MHDVNELNQPIGTEVKNWQPCQHPQGACLEGRFCRLEPLIVNQHGDDLWHAFARDGSQRNWTYLPYGPFATQVEFENWIEITCLSPDPCFFAIIDLQHQQAVGMSSYLRIAASIGVIEVGHIHFSPLMQATVLSTESMYLMMQYIFDDLGYRRYEWKCDALNAASRKAAERLGFRYEGLFRQATLYKGRNRDTAWYAITDHEWPGIKQAFERYFRTDNFDASGRQYSSLSAGRQMVV